MKLGTVKRDRIRLVSAASLFVATTLVVAACTADHDGGGAAASSVAAATSNSAIHPPFPTLTAPSLQPPKQQNENRPDVAFDPCTWIDDHTVQKIGYDPSTRKRSIDIHAEYTFLSCEFLTADKAYSIEILSGNRTMDEGRQKFTTDGAQIEDATIEGRAAMIVRTKTPESCDVLLQTKAGYVDFDRIIAGYLIDGPTPERCSGIVDLVRSIVPRIGNY